ncbi:hypothetical protein JCM3774_002796 [Rhodotorula dairenensis]
MDIDLPPVAAAHLSEFGLRYPLPFRILLLSAVTLLAFATNVHLLSALGIDTARVLDVRLDSHAHAFVHPTTLYPPLYALAAAVAAYTALGWLVFRAAAGGHADAAIHWRVLPAACLVAAALAVAWPGNALCRRDRYRFLRALRRIVAPSLNAPVPFADIILADILTSSAKVLGDVWIAGCLVVQGRGVQLVADECKRVWGVPFMTALPYIFRFRQCLSEVYTGSTPTPRRSLLNALKYATAFPVIVLSAMQTVIGDPFDPDEAPHEAGERFIGRTTLFNLWILAVMINSLYSFWWDVTNDWGLSLLTPSGWSSSPAVSYAFIHPPAGHPNHHHHAPFPVRASRLASSSRSASLSGPSQHHRVRSLANGHAPSAVVAAAAVTEDGSQHLSTLYPPPPSRPHSPMPVPKPTAPARLLSSAAAAASSTGPGLTPHPHPHPGSGSAHTRAFSTATAPNLSYPFLRPILLLPDPSVYYLCIVLDLVLRLTWSLKLSSHLHSAQEVEAGVFLVELLEVVRRWIWVYLRIEWEAVRKGAGSEVISGDEDLSAAASSSLLPSNGLGVGEASSSVLWSEKGDAEARLRAQQEEYELAALWNGGSSSGGAGPGPGPGPGGGGWSGVNGSAAASPDLKVAPVVDIPSRV